MNQLYSSDLQVCASITEGFWFWCGKVTLGAGVSLGSPKGTTHTITSMRIAKGGIANRRWENQHRDTLMCEHTKVNLAREPEPILTMRESMWVNSFNWKHGSEQPALLLWRQLSAWNEKYLIDILVYSTVKLSEKGKRNSNWGKKKAKLFRYKNILVVKVLF